MTREEGTVKVPKGYFFKMAKMDYNDWRHALAREFFQNSVDADSSKIEVATDSTRRVVHIVDNGCGMDYDTIKEKLLVFGGSKKATGGVGAFGKAKEILFFSWEKYEIRTRNWLVTGEGADYTIEEVDEWTDGTECTIWLWENVDFNEVVSGFNYVARRFEVDCTILIDGEAIAPVLKRGELLRRLDWADLYIDREVKSYYISVRIDGQWMFSDWLSDARDFGTLLLEVHGDSTDVLTSNRDSLKGDDKQKLRALVNEFVTETRSALEPEKVIVKEKFTGLGKVAVNRAKAAEKISEYINNLYDEVAPTKESIEEVVDSIIDRLPAENVTVLDVDRVTETVNEVSKARESYWNYEDRFSFIGFQPDFHVIYEEGSTAGKKLEKYLQWPSVISLANAWTEILKQVFLDIEEYIDFHVGFNFSLTQAASYSRVKGEHYFYLNPNLLLSDCEGKPHWRHQRTLLREDLVLKAIHEITHLYVSDHVEDFTMKSEWIRARTWKSLKTYPKIIKECFRK